MLIMSHEYFENNWLLFDKNDKFLGKKNNLSHKNCWQEWIHGCWESELWIYPPLMFIVLHACLLERLLEHSFLCYLFFCLPFSTRSSSEICLLSVRASVILAPSRLLRRHLNQRKATLRASWRPPRSTAPMTSWGTTTSQSPPSTNSRPRGPQSPAKTTTTPGTW